MVRLKELIGDGPQGHIWAKDSQLKHPKMPGLMLTHYTQVNYHTQSIIVDIDQQHVFGCALNFAVENITSARCTVV